MSDLDEIHKLEKIWRKAYDIAKIKEESISKNDLNIYWCEVSIAWKVQNKIREIIDKKIDDYVENNIEILMKDFK